MNKKMSKRQRDIKSKLMAAIAMLLVSSIMMVSTTYAWFTLSTAPEVTGISTAVGANGNLEMALLPENGLAPNQVDFGITTITNATGKQPNETNVTWGNLVDLGYEHTTGNNYYGLDKITLYPSELNATMGTDGRNPSALASVFLKTPTYGADGRVSDVLANTVTSTYVANDGNFPQKTEATGVRTVGVASGMTDRQIAYRGYRSSASSAMNQAKNLASTSLNTNGASLADIALAHGVKADAKHTQAEVTSLLAIVNDLAGYEKNGSHVTGVLEYIEKAYRDYIITFVASSLSNLSDIEANAFVSTASSMTLSEVVALLEDKEMTLNTAASEAIGKLSATKAKVLAAQTELQTIQGYGDVEITWGNTGEGEGAKLGISTPLYKLADTNAMKINGHAASTVKENMSAIVNSVMSEGLTVTIATNGGVYADIADHCGDYNAAITIKKVEYNGLALENMTARMETKTTVPVVYLKAFDVLVANKAPEGGDTVMPISDHYGYIIDLAFRTNAAESNLLLQTTPIDRIYSDNTDKTMDTMGGGSTMTFTSESTSFSETQMKGLMKCIRIVFFNPSDYSVYATAMLDADNGTVTGGNTIEAPIYIYTNENATVDYVVIQGEYTGDRYVAVTEYVEIGAAKTEGVEYVNEGGNFATHVSDGAGGFKEATTTDTATHIKREGYKKDAENGTFKKVETAAGPQMKKGDGQGVITALTQNQATAVSALVYLDGTKVTNADVATTAKSMTGSMNLQFSSSATLVPMNYTPLMNQTSGGNTGD